LKANLRNVALLERRAADPQAARRGDRLFVVLLSAALLLTGAAVLAVGVALPIWLLSR
jgi:predicted small integral membrane protein